MTAMRDAEEACIAQVMQAQGLDRTAATRFPHRSIERAGYQSDPELCPLVVAYKTAVKDHGYSGAAERHVRDVIEAGRQRSASGVKSQRPDGQHGRQDVGAAPLACYLGLALASTVAACYAVSRGVKMTGSEASDLRERHAIKRTAGTLKQLRFTGDEPPFSSDARTTRR